MTIRKIVLKILTKVILKYFKEGVEPIYGGGEYKNKAVAYRWTWKIDD